MNISKPSEENIQINSTESAVQVEKTTKNQGTVFLLGINTRRM